LKKVIVWIKERLFLVALILFGVIYLTVSGEWRVYTDPFVQAGAWLKAQFGSEEVSGEAGEDKEIVVDKDKEDTKKPVPVKPDVSGGDVSANDVSSGDVSANDVSSGDVSANDVSAGDAVIKNKVSEEADESSVSDNDAEPSITTKPLKEEEASSKEAIPEKDKFSEQGASSSAEKVADAVTEVSGGDAKPLDTEVVEEDAIEEESDEVVYRTAGEDYFADALFIGNSRTVGMYEYGGLRDVATFYATNGLTIQKVLSASIVEVEGRKEKITVEEALQEKQFGKIYLMLGINEMGTGTVETFMKKYAEVVERLQELQPDATIYLQGIMKVTDKRSAKGDYIHNEGIDARNVEIAKLADNKQVFYLDMNSVVCEENGGLKASYTGDGVHLKAQYYDIWKEYLLEHVADKP